MYFETLKEENIEQYLTYLKLAMEQEPDMMTAEKFDEEGISIPYPQMDLHVKKNIIID